MPSTHETTITSSDPEAPRAPVRIGCGQASATRPLDGITIVSLEHAIAAPICTRHLADLGARVIKIERPGAGDFARGYDNRVHGLASHFVWANRTKQSLTLDLKHPQAFVVLTQLLAKADVFVQNLAPGATARMGLDYDTLRHLNPRLIVCDISGYGCDGPDRDRKAYDLLIQSEAGLLEITGTPDQRCKSGVSIADISAGMYAYSGVLVALLQRQQTGQGSRIDVSMLECLGEWMGYPMYYAYDGQPAPARTGASHATIYPYGPFQTGDGHAVVLGVQNEREWKAFCEKVLLDPGLAADPRFAGNTARASHRTELRAIIDETLRSLTSEQTLARLDEARIASASLNGAGDIWHHRQLKARDRFRAIDSPAGELKAMLPPAANSGFEYRMGAVPAVGEHSESILRELGHGPEEIAALRAAGAT